MLPLTLNRKTVLEYAAKYPAGYDQPIAELVAEVQKRGHLTKLEFEIVGEWKSPRARPKLRSNSAEHIEEASRIALSTPVEELGIGVLLTLNGVSYPMASVILHWFHSDPYPILDFRALESLGIPIPNQYTSEFWMHYVTRWRKALTESDVDKRTLDRALWQWSKDRSDSRVQRT
ncbi:MAG TPA: hypothetical protein PLX06_08375 [Fimbriimonadaceae bacterium]|nr:hypothetical protein [Fimbriimonadaceae bacterium]